MKFVSCSVKRSKISMAVENRLAVISIIPRFRRQNDFIDKDCLCFFTVFVVVVLCLLAPLIIIQIRSYHNIRCMCLEPSITDSNETIGEFSLAKVPKETKFNISGPIRREIEFSDVNEVSYIKSLPLNNSQQNDFDNRQQRRKPKLKYASMNKNTTKKLNSSESTKPISNQTEGKNRDPRGGEHVYNENPANLLFDVILRECQQTTVCLKCLKPLTTKRQFYSIATNFGDRYPTVAAMPLDKFDNGCQRSKVACHPTLCPVTICPVTICPAAPVCETTTQLCQTTAVTLLCKTTTTTPPCPTTTRTCIKKICYFPTECIETTPYDCKIEPSWSFAVANYKVTLLQLSTNCDGEIITHPTRPTMKCFPAWWSCRTKCTKTTTCEYEMVTPRC
ncbi:hypothetical protein CHUAL_012557 [Chamberlinius hualienensis]